MMLVAFDSTQQALHAEMMLEYAEIDIDICPTPKAITAGCALSIEFENEDLVEVRRIVKAEKIEIHGIYEYIEGQYVMVSE